MLTGLEYFKSVKGLARDILDEAIRRTAEDYGVSGTEDCGVYNKDDVLRVLDIEGLLYEYVDNDELVIYTKYHLDILRYTQNEEAIYDFYGDEDLEKVLHDGGISKLVEMQAAFAYAADVYHEILEMELFDE